MGARGLPVPPVQAGAGAGGRRRPRRPPRGCGCSCPPRPPGPRQGPVAKGGCGWSRDQVVQEGGSTPAPKRVLNLPSNPWAPHRASRAEGGPRSGGGGVSGRPTPHATPTPTPRMGQGRENVSQWAMAEPWGTKGELEPILRPINPPAPLPEKLPFLTFFPVQTRSIPGAVGGCWGPGPGLPEAFGPLPPLGQPPQHHRHVPTLEPGPTGGTRWRRGGGVIPPSPFNG